jgi:butyrate kinase
MKDYYILVINPGSTSTQVALFKNQNCLKEESIEHTSEQLSMEVDNQKEFRKKAVMNFIKGMDIEFNDLSAIAARGGRIKPIKSGTYLVDEAMIRDSESKENGNHASRLAVIIGNEIANEVGCNVYSVDPISVDEMIDMARISGIPEIERKSLSHALNMKAVCRKTAYDLNKDYDDSNIVVAHLGGGTTISCNRKGQMIDLINDFEGIFTPERAGGLPNLQLVKLCFSGKYSENEIIRKLEGLGGFYSYLGTKDFKEIEQRIAEGDNYAKLIMDAYLYQLTKAIGSMLAVLEYKVDAISITGSISKSDNVINKIKSIFSSIAPILVYHGSFEMEALANGVLKVLEGKEKPKNYSLESGTNEKFQ